VSPDTDILKLGSHPQVDVSGPQLEDDDGQDDEESVPAQGDSEASPHHHPGETPA
jgi:hypothetical protein